MNELLDSITGLIRELRNSRDIERNWAEFSEIVELNQDRIVAEFSMRWLRSICDTYADFGPEPEMHNALKISMFINMVRLAETARFIRGPISPELLAQTRDERHPLYDELHTFSINKQDVFLNLSKRMARQMQEGALMWKIWREVLVRFQRNGSIIAEFQSLSAMPERYFPVDPLSMEDNYGVA
ncbi:hypothetical protein ACQZ4R_11535 [Agrobacterium vitis]